MSFSEPHDTHNKTLLNSAFSNGSSNTNNSSTAVSIHPPSLDVVSPLTKRFSHILMNQQQTLTNASSCSSSPKTCSPFSQGVNKASTQCILLKSFHDPLSRPNNPPSPFEAIELSLTEGTSIKIGRPIKSIVESISTTIGNPVDNSIASSAPELNSSPAQQDVSMESHSLQENTNNNAVLQKQEQEQQNFTNLQTKTNQVWFKSKVVSRHHAELWLKNGQVSFFSLKNNQTCFTKLTKKTSFPLDLY
jgi:hypothetical protein